MEDIDDDRAVEILYQLWDENVLPKPRPNLAEMHFVLGGLAKRKHTCAVPGLLSRIDLLQVDPQSTIRYLINTASEDQDVA